MRRKRYDPTLARIAGNITAGLVTVTTATFNRKELTSLALDMALDIVKKAKKVYKRGQ